MRSAIFTAAIVTSLMTAGTAFGGTLQIIGTSPAANATAAPIQPQIVLEFDRALDPKTVAPNAFCVFGRWSGVMTGTFEVEGGDTVVFTPDRAFSAGESVTVMVDNSLAGDDGSPIRSVGFAMQFWVRAATRLELDLVQVASMTTRTTPGESSRAYGGIGSDLNHDGFNDITIVNEDTADLRVFLNQGNGDAAFDPFMEPTYPVNQQASPSEPADFNGDGHTDICVANISADTVSVLLGNGDGTFDPHQEIAVGNAPRGIAVLDVDGDGDVDIANTNASSGNISILLNNGSGVFGAPSFFEGGVSGEWSLAAADMNNDGILDLITGGSSGQSVVVNLANGDGTFTPQAAFSAGGRSWMIATGDVDGDGNVDISTANSSNNNGGIVFGNGAGGFSGTQTYGTDSFPLATDLGDIDGDGDLDWVVSCFGGDFFMFLNDGDGNFTFVEEFDAPTAASCALLVDLDNDLDVDLVLVDELADVVMIRRNMADLIPGDLNGDGAVTSVDLLLMLQEWGACGACIADVDLDGDVGINDLLILLANWT